MAAEYKGKRRFIRFGVPGAGDIFGVLPPGDGRFLSVECKRDGNQPTAKQLAFMQAVNAQSGVAFWVDDARHLDTILDHVLAGGRVEVDGTAQITIIPAEQTA